MAFTRNISFIVAKIRKMIGLAIRFIRVSCVLLRQKCIFSAHAQLWPYLAGMRTLFTYDFFYLCSQMSILYIMKKHHGKFF
jgi:hypothetical protein